MHSRLKYPFSLATNLGIPVKEDTKTNFISEKEHQNILVFDKSNNIMQNDNDYDVRRINAGVDEETPDPVISNAESFHLKNDLYSVETPSPYPCMDIHEGDSLDSSKQTSASVSPLVVLPLPDEALSKEDKHCSQFTLSNDVNVDLRSNKNRMAPKQKYKTRVNELAEYAKQYEDLYTRRMGALNCNSSTSGSIPSASGSGYRYQRQSFCHVRAMPVNGNEQINFDQDAMRSPALSVDSPLPTQPIDFNEYGSYSKTHQNVIQWVQNQHTFTSEVSVRRDLDFSSIPAENDLSSNTNHHEINLSHAENKTCQRQSAQLDCTKDGTYPKCNSSSSFSNVGSALKNEGGGDPNQSGLPNVDIVRRPGGVKSLVSAFNEQIESHKVRYLKFKRFDTVIFYIF